MKPSPEQAERFISHLITYGWEVNGDHIYSEKGSLHFPYPDAWDSELSDLKEILQRRRDRFKYSSIESHLSDDDRSHLIRVHTQALRAIDCVT